MQNKAFVLRVSIAVALCATGLSAPAAADDGPTGAPTPRPIADVSSPPRSFAAFEAFVQLATSATATQNASDGAAGQTAAPVSGAPGALTATPPRAAVLARSAPRAFTTYDALTDYAVLVAAAQQASNDRLAAVLASEDAARTTL